MSLLKAALNLAQIIHNIVALYNYRMFKLIAGLVLLHYPFASNQIVMRFCQTSTFQRKIDEGTARPDAPLRPCQNSQWV